MRVQMKRAALVIPCVLLAIGLAMLLGCVGAMPSASARTDDHGHAWVANRGDQGVKTGEVDRETVLALLGRPDVTMADGKLVAYTWTIRRSVHFTGWGATCFDGVKGGSGTESFVDEQTQYLLLEFDDAGILRQKKLHQGGRINIYARGIKDAIL
jgi:hypothetical protein